MRGLAFAVFGGSWGANHAGTDDLLLLNRFGDGATSNGRLWLARSLVEFSVEGDKCGSSH
jgi:hypothetical protein